MKTIKYLAYTLALTISFSACEQEVLELQDPTPDLTNIGDDPCTGSAGSADFTKFVAIGNSLTAGYQAGALFTEGQNNSLAKILSNQFKCVGGGEFNQPDINSVNGYNASFSNPENGIIRGRLILFDSDGPGPKSASPVPAGTPGLPAPYNTADLPTAFSGDKSKLNNFAVPGILLGQALTPETGNPASPYYNPLWARFASQPGGKSIIQDAIAAQGTFFLFWLGNNDVLGYAVGGAVSTGVQMTDPAAFSGYYQNAIGLLLQSNPDLKGVVGNIPNVTSIPYFNTITYNYVPLDASTATQLNTAFAGYNELLEGFKPNAAAFGFTSDELESRKIFYAESKSNKILIKDEDAKDLGQLFDYAFSNGLITQDERNNLEPYRLARQTTSSDLITLSAGAVLGTPFNGSAILINGLTWPLEDKYVLTPNEIQTIKTRTDEFNNAIASVVANSNDRVALADINAAFTTLVQNKFAIINGVTITPSFAPPSGAFSEDGVHPNSRGMAYMANIFIDAINAKFGATIPKANLSKYKATALPSNP